MPGGLTVTPICRDRLLVVERDTMSCLAAKHNYKVTFYFYFFFCNYFPKTFVKVLLQDFQLYIWSSMTQCRLRDQM